MTSDPDLLSPAQLAERWGVTRQHVYALMADGLPSIRLGRSRRIRRTDADAYLDAHQVGAHGPGTAA